MEAQHRQHWRHTHTHIHTAVIIMMIMMIMTINMYQRWRKSSRKRWKISRYSANCNRAATHWLRRCRRHRIPPTAKLSKPVTPSSTSKESMSYGFVDICFCIYTLIYLFFKKKDLSESSNYFCRTPNVHIITNCPIQSNHCFSPPAPASHLPPPATPALIAALLPGCYSTRHGHIYPHVHVCYILLYLVMVMIVVDW